MKKSILLSLSIAICTLSFGQQRTMTIHSVEGEETLLISSVDSITFGEIGTFESVTNFELPYLYNKGMSVAVADDGTVFFGNDGKSTDPSRGDANIFAVKDGAQVWSYLSGEVVRSAPTISADGTKVYFGDYNDSIFIFDAADGTIEKKIGIGGDSKYSSFALADDGTLYVGRNNDKLFAVDPINGIVKWTYEASNDILSTPVIDAAGNVYFSVNNDSIRSFTPEGVQRWSSSYGGELNKGYIASCPAISETDGVLYFSGKVYPDDNSSLIAFNLSDGTVKWTVERAKTEQGGVAVDAEGNVYLGSEEDGLMIAYDKMGSELWRFKANGGILAVPAIDDAGNLYFGDDTGNFYMLDKNGNLLKNSELGTSIISSAAIGQDGKIYILVNTAEDKSKLFVLETGATGPANSDWPMFGNNAKRTSRKMN